MEDLERNTYLTLLGTGLALVGRLVSKLRNGKESTVEKTPGNGTPKLVEWSDYQVLDGRISGVNTEVVRLQSDQQHLEKTVDEMKDKVDKSHDLLTKLCAKLGVE